MPASLPHLSSSSDRRAVASIPRSAIAGCNVPNVTQSCIPPAQRLILVHAERSNADTTRIYIWHVVAMPRARRTRPTPGRSILDTQFTKCYLPNQDYVFTCLVCGRQMSRSQAYKHSRTTDCGTKVSDNVGAANRSPHRPTTGADPPEDCNDGSLRAYVADMPPSASHPDIPPAILTPLQVC